MAAEAGSGSTPQAGLIGGQSVWQSATLSSKVGAIGIIMHNRRGLPAPRADAAVGASDRSRLRPRG
jgi:hypothetical protein